MNHTSEYTMSLWTQAQADIDTGQGERKGERQKHSVSVYHCVTHTHMHARRQTLKEFSVLMYTWSDDKFADIRSCTHCMQCNCCCCCCLHSRFSCVYCAVVFAFVVIFIYFFRSFAISLIYSRTESVKTIKSERCSYLFSHILSGPNIFYQQHDFILNAELLIYLLSLSRSFHLSLCVCVEIECARYGKSVCFPLFCSIFFLQKTNIRSAMYLLLLQFTFNVNH